MAVDFYNRLTPFYHLIYPDWEASIRKQAEDIDAILRHHWGNGRLAILDVACGIGTQALGLAELGHHVTGSDLAEAAIERARQEVTARGLNIPLSIADMRQVYDHHQRQFDVVIACDNAVPHLLSDDDLLRAFQQFFACARPGGSCLLTVRDYDKEERTGVQVKPYGVRIDNGVRYLIWQVWEFHGPIYDLSMYFVADRGEAECLTHVMRAQYYAVGSETLRRLLREAGFVEVKQLDGCFYQPVILGKKPLS